MKIEENNEIKFTDTNKTNKIRFFARVKRAIFNVEKYGEFLAEKMSTVVKYFLLLTFITSLVLAGVSTYNFYTIVDKTYSYIKNELPDFTYENGQLNFVSQAEGYDKDIDLYNIINTTGITDSIKEDYKEKIKGYTHGIIFLQKEVIVSEAGQFNEYKYDELNQMYDANISNKADLIDKLDSIGAWGICITYFILISLSLYMVNVLTYLSDIIVLCLFGYLTSKIVGLSLNFAKCFILSNYAITLSIILSTIYSLVYSLTGFVVEYFNIMYLLVAYIYIVAAILIIKSDLIKQQAELQEIYKVEAEVKKELQEQREKEKEEDSDKEDSEDSEKKKKGKEKKEKDKPVINREPDGSEI